MTVTLIRFADICSLYELLVVRNIIKDAKEKGNLKLSNLN